MITDKTIYGLLEKHRESLYDEINPDRTLEAYDTGNDMYNAATELMLPLIEALGKITGGLNRSGVPHGEAGIAKRALANLKEKLNERQSAVCLLRRDK